MKCVKCNSLVPDNSKFCPHCGAKVVAVVVNKCSYCGFEGIPNDAVFCPRCGQKRIEIIEKEEKEQKEKALREALAEAERLAAQRKQREEELRRQKEAELRRQQEEELRKQREEELQRKREEELRRKREEEIRRQKEEELRRQQAEEKRLKLMEYDKKAYPVKMEVAKIKSELANVQKEYDAYKSMSCALHCEEKIIEEWEEENLSGKFGIVHRNYKMKYRWWMDLGDKLNDFSKKGWDSCPICFTEYLQNALFIISYPFRVVIMLPWAFIIVALLPIYLISYPFSSIAFWFRWANRVANYKEPHVDTLNRLQQEIKRFNSEELCRNIDYYKAQIIEKEKILAALNKEYAKWLM